MHIRIHILALIITDRIGAGAAVALLRRRDVLLLVLLDLLCVTLALVIQLLVLGLDLRLAVVRFAASTGTG
jgi:hypothetical protein